MDYLCVLVGMLPVCVLGHASLTTVSSSVSFLLFVSVLPLNLFGLSVVAQRTYLVSRLCNTCRLLLAPCHRSCVVQLLQTTELFPQFGGQLGLYLTGFKRTQDCKPIRGANAR